MNWLNFFKKAKSNQLTENDLVEASICPNCWGKQEWNGKFVEYVEDRQRAANLGDPTAQKAFVEQFIEKHITGIRLKSDGDYLSCPTCNAKFKKVLGDAN